MKNTIDLQVDDRTQVKLCLKCGKELSRKQGKFCSPSCNASYHNAKKVGKDARNWQGGKSIKTDGYVRIRIPEHPNACDGYVYEHRYVMEQEIGRLLTSEEVVHHNNKDRKDNRIENLRLFNNQKEHIRHHNQLKKQIS